MHSKEYLIKQYKNIYKDKLESTEVKVVFSPGRINLIGEHIDYNGGLVLPLCIDKGTYLAYQVRSSLKINVYSKGFSDDIISLDLNNFELAEDDGWIRYIKGCIKVLLDKGYNIEKGLNLYISHNIPIGSGLSSSASLEMLLLSAFNLEFDLNINDIDLIKLGKEVENTYIGLNSGIMDQAIIKLGQKDKGLLLNTSTLEYEYVDFKLKDYSIIIINSNVKHSLVTSEYNHRVIECQDALAIAKEHYNVEHLCDLNISQLKGIESYFDYPVVYRRARHCVTEMNRVLEMKESLINKDYIKAGRLLNESHVSLREDYEVSCLETDYLINILKETPSLGSRIVGGGFGGCIIALVPSNSANLIKDIILQKSENSPYPRCDVYKVKISQGVHYLD